eukprot:TRINITY_DN2982_c0_g1_i6.p1 TRINITY_DN2982_c0_g1~~TRINITY_DN2982_c0_g1_i6.p1  ORF type:complete len:635 (+),score=90.60 TRINITY_DN2982_c0_g1_i6:34-1938(+)
MTGVDAMEKKSSCCCTVCCGAVLEFFLNPILREDDTNDERVRKKIIILATLIMTSVSFFAVVVSNNNEGEFLMTLSNITMIMWVLFASGIYMYFCAVKRVTDRALQIMTMVGSLAVFATDLHAAASFQTRAWPMFVIVLDVLLIVNMQATAKILVGIVAVWILLVTIESGLRFGLFDIPGLSPQSQRLESVECDLLPCPVNAWVQSGALGVMIFITDFAITRGFSTELQRQMAALEESVRVSGLLAKHLAAYDLDSAESELQLHHGNLPEEMTAVFRELLANLQSYRPFLPDALFGDGDDDTERCSSWSKRSSNATATTVDTARSADNVSVESRSVASSCRNTGTRSPRARAAVRHQTQLSRVPLTLMVVSMRTCEEAADPAWIAQHTAWLTKVFQCVREERGALDRFDGDRVYASFNAFRKALNHVSNALSAATTVKTMGHPDTATSTTAVVTGEMYAGYLGTAALRSPTVVGPLPHLLDSVLRAGELAEECVVCCPQVHARTTGFPLRMLLHRFFFDEALACPVWGAVEAGVGRCLYVLDGPANGEVQEWMYELADVEGRWHEYNIAAAARHNGTGTSTVAEKLRAAGVDEDVADCFAAACRTAMRLDLRVRREPLEEVSVTPVMRRVSSVT